MALVVMARKAYGEDALEDYPNLAVKAKLLLAGDSIFFCL